MKTRTLIIAGMIVIFGMSYLGISWYIAVENDLDCALPDSGCTTLPVEKPNVTIIRGSTIMKHNLSPSEITIDVGKQVTWYNDDDASHWIDADDGSWSSGLISPQNYFTMKFEKAGVYTYHGQPWITGTVIVTEKRNGLEDVWITDEDYCGDWCNQDELYRLGCDKPILGHLARYSNLLDGRFDGTYMIDFTGLPDGVSQEKFDECVDAIYRFRLSLHFEKLFTENQIGTPKDLVVKSVASIGGDPVCGIAVDDSERLRWFAVDSLSNPSRMTIFKENPQPCKVNTSSCFCDAYVELVAPTTKQTYFTQEEEQKYSGILIDYLSEENINRTPKFLIGKLDINYTDSGTGYCGQMWGKNTYGFFSGGMINDTVVSYRISKGLPLLCAISDDAKWQERR